jgi:predicted ribosomally synthesized peptide with nif11-like leader
MSQTNATRFLEATHQDPSLQEKLATVTTIDDIVTLATEAGFPISAEDLKQAISAEDLEKAREVLSEKELESVAGGGDFGYLPHMSYGPVPCTTVACVAINEGIDVTQGKGL